MIKYIKGDLFKLIQPNSIITHVCNSKGKWGSGFVIPLGKHYPKAKECYLDWHKTGCGIEGEFKQGNCQIMCVDTNKDVWVANMVAQTLGGKRPLNYHHLVKCMDDVANFAIGCNLDVIAPKFGSDRAGGNWDFVECLIEDIWTNLNVTIVVYE